MVARNKIWIACLTLLGVATLPAGCARRPAVVAEPAQPPQPVAVAPAPAEPSSAEVRNLDSLLRRIVLHFDFDEAVLKPDDQTQLQKLAELLRSTPTARIRISGNCDERGTEEYNLALGHRRAEVAKKYLADLGINQVRVDTVSYGYEKPVDPRHTEEAWAANRRDEFASIGDN